MKTLQTTSIYLALLLVSSLFLASCATPSQPAPSAPAKVNLLEIKATTPETPASLGLKQKFTVTIHYNNPGPNPVNIWAMPYTKGKFPNSGGVEPSRALATGSGEITRFFECSSPAVVDEVVVEMRDSITKELIAEVKLPVQLTWK